MKVKKIKNKLIKYRFHKWCSPRSPWSFWDTVARETGSGQHSVFEFIPRSFFDDSGLVMIMMIINSICYFKYMPVSGVTC